MANTPVLPPEHLGLPANTRLYYSAFAYAAGGLFAAPLQLEVITKPDRPENLRVIDK